MLDQRVPLSPVSPTPVQPMDRLGAALGLEPGRLWVKRDDLTGLGGGGNKVRKLEYLCADALAQGCDVLVTGGGRQSNHARVTAAAANHLGLDCTLVLGSDPVDVATGNVVLDQLLGPEIVWAGPLEYYALEAAIDEAAARLRAAGRRPYAMPLGGASTVGQLGYVQAASELRDQLPDTALIATADGTGGTHAGLVAGWGDHAAVLGVDVGTRPDLDDAVPREAAAAAALAGRPAPVGTCVIDHDRIGGGYGAPTRGCREALDLCARREGLLLDPVYSGKGMAGLIAAIREDRVPRDGTIVFLHTGGLPALLTPAVHGLGGRVAVMHDPTEVRATVDAYIDVRARIEVGDATWLDLADFFTDDAVYIDPAWGRIQGIEEIRAFLVDSMRGLEDWHFPMRFAAIEGDDIVTVWTQTLPGARADGQPYTQTGVSILRYAGDGKFSYEEDLLNMVHVLEDLGTSGWRPGVGFTSPPANPDRTTG